MKKVSGLILKLLGWKINVDKQFMIDKAVVVMAPHTSMIDFWIGRFAFWSLGLPARFLIKKELFWFPMGIMLKSMGAVPVDRKRIGNLTESIVQMFREKKKFMFTITPEGTRKLNHHWKRGFYQIAQEAEVPILLGYVDYKKKEGGIGKMIIPTGNFEEDLKEVQTFYYNITARHPEKFNLSEMYRKYKKTDPSQDNFSKK